ARQLLVRALPSFSRLGPPRQFTACRRLDDTRKFLYVSMRLDGVTPGSLVVYGIDDNGGLTFVEQQSSRGLTPRQFCLSKDGKQLIVGNQNSAKIELFAVDTESGALSF